MAWPDQSFPTDVRDLFRFLLEREMDDPTNLDWIWRGESQEFPAILPGLARHANWPRLDFRTRREIEDSTISGFWHSLLPLVDPTDLLGCYSETGPTFHLWHFAQHHGCPTRLVDWTRSAWAALYFACVDNPDHDGQIYCFNAKALEQTASARWDSYGVPLRADGQRDLMASIRSSIESDWIVTQYSHAPNQRMKAQIGLFTVAGTSAKGHEELIADNVPENERFRIRLPREHKIGVLGLLRAMNTTHISLQVPKLDERGKKAARTLLDACDSVFPTLHPVATAAPPS